MDGINERLSNDDSNSYCIVNFPNRNQPPGGGWQENSGTQQGCAPDQTCKAGTLDVIEL